MPDEQRAVQWRGQVAVVPLPGEIDIANADAVRDRLLVTLGEGPAVLIADMSTTTFCDSAGVRALVQVSQQTRAAGVGLRLAITARGIMRVLTISGADSLMEVYDSVTAAAGAPAPATPEQARRGQPAQEPPAGPEPAGEPETAVP